MTDPYEAVAFATILVTFITFGGLAFSLRKLRKKRKIKTLQEQIAQLEAAVDASTKELADIS